MIYGQSNIKQAFRRYFCELKNILNIQVYYIKER